MRFALALLVLLAPAPAAAQRLAYEDVLTPGPGPRLAYRPMAIAEQANVATTAPRWPNRSAAHMRSG